MFGKISFRCKTVLVLEDQQIQIEEALRGLVFSIPARPGSIPLIPVKTDQERPDPIRPDPMLSSLARSFLLMTRNDQVIPAPSLCDGQCDGEHDPRQALRRSAENIFGPLARDIWPTSETEAELATLIKKGTRGAHNKIAARNVARMAARIYQLVTGKKMTVIPSGPNALGPSVRFLQAIYGALGMRCSAESQIRKIMSARRLAKIASGKDGYPV